MKTTTTVKPSATSTIPAEKLLSYVAMQLMQKSEISRTLANMAREDNCPGYSLDFEGFSRDLDGLAGMILSHTSK